MITCIWHFVLCLHIPSLKDFKGCCSCESSSYIYRNIEKWFYIGRWLFNLLN